MGLTQRPVQIEPVSTAGREYNVVREPTACTQHSALPHAHLKHTGSTGSTATLLHVIEQHRLPAFEAWKACLPANGRAAKGVA